MSTAVSAAPETRTSFAAMGTVVDLRVRAHDADAFLAGCRDLVRHLEELLSRFRAGSDVSALNRSAGRWVSVHRHTRAVLESARDFARATGGAYDPVLGAVVDLWDGSDHRDDASPAGRPRDGALRGRVPSGGDVARARSRSGIRLLECDGQGRYRLPAGAGVDLGGIAKGYAADRVRDLCAERGASTALVSIGSSSIAVLGSPAGGGPWRIGLRDPAGDAASRVGSVDVPSGAASTSGDYVRASEPEGRLVHHVIDTRTHRPQASGLRAVTVLAGDGARAEAWSTAMLARGLGWSVEACGRTDDLEAIFLTDEALLATPGIHSRVRGRIAARRHA